MYGDGQSGLGRKMILLSVKERRTSGSCRLISINQHPLEIDGQHI